MAGSDPAARPRLVLIGGHAGRSGVASYIRQIAVALGETARISVIADTDGSGYDYLAALGARHIGVPGMARSRNPLRLLATALAFRRALRGQAADLVWANSGLPITLTRIWLIERWLRRERRPALIVTCHGPPFGPGRRWLAAGLGWVVEMALLAATPRHWVVFVAQQDRDSYPRWPLGRHRTVVLANTSDLGPLPRVPAGARPRIVMTTRAGYQKNLAAAARILAALPPDHDLRLLGEGTDAAALLDSLRAGVPGGDARLIGRGPQSPEVVRAELAAADCYLLTSRYEGMPIGAIEAFEAGLPLAMTPVGGAAELAGAHPAFALIDPGATAAEQAAAVARLIAAHRADRSAAQARIRAAWAHHFAPAAWQARIRALVTAALAGG